MADKELTVFVVDLHPLVRAKHLHYVFDVLAGKLLKGLKTDYVSVVGFHAPETKHKLADRGVFKGICVLVDFEVPTFLQLQLLRLSLVENHHFEHDSDSFQALIFSVSLFQDTKTKQFTRNIVLVTSSLLPLGSYAPEKAEAIPGLLKGMDINLMVIGVDFDAKTREIWDFVAGHFPTALVLTAEEAEQVALVPPLKKTRPMPVYKGHLRFGADFLRILHDSTYRPDLDESCLTWNVEVYPAAKSEIASLSAHEYIVDKKLVRVDRKTRHFVWEKNPEYQDNEDQLDGEVDDKKFDKIDVESSSFTPGFKFSNFDLIALDHDLTEAARLDFASAFDVLAFVKTEKIPYAFFTDEALFVVPEKASSSKNLLSHCAFSEALYELGTSPIVRFVRKQMKEIEVGAMVPVKVKNDGEFTYCFVFIRFPFKEDEKIGNFPSLSEGIKKEDATKPEKQVNKLMEEFIQSKTYVGADEEDDTTEYKTVVDNYKVTLKGSDSSKLPLPPKFESAFMFNSPAANRFNVYLRRILTKSLDADDWTRFFQNPRFIEDNIREGEFTNFFNLSNCTGSDWLSFNEKSKKPAKRLALELGVKYIRKEDLKKKKAKRNVDLLQSKGNYGADEGFYDAVPDFDF